MEDTQCVIPSDHFVAAPFNLAWADHVNAKVIASNWRGDSLESEPGNGAQIFRVPDAPLNLQNDPSITVSTLIGINWEIGQVNGGTPVLDYRITYD